MVEPPRHALAGVDVPAGRPFEPAAGGQAKAPAVALALERYFGHNRFGADHLEVETWLEHVVDETQLHQRGLQQNAPIFELR